MKLTKAQWAMLENIGQWERARPSMSAHINYAPFRRLIRKGCIEKVKITGQQCAYFALTFAGRQALDERGRGG